MTEKEGMEEQRFHHSEVFPCGLYLTPFAVHPLQKDCQSCLREGKSSTTSEGHKGKHSISCQILEFQTSLFIHFMV